MANYFATGKAPLAMECPHCHEFSGHEVVRTFPQHFRWTDATTPLFQRIVGRDIAFRKRLKRCVGCNRTFQSIELSQHYLSALINEVQKLQMRVLAAENARSELVEENTDLSTRLKGIKKLANRRRSR